MFDLKCDFFCDKFNCNKWIKFCNIWLIVIVNIFWKLMKLYILYIIIKSYMRNCGDLILSFVFF